MEAANQVLESNFVLSDLSSYQAVVLQTVYLS